MAIYQLHLSNLLHCIGSMPSHGPYCCVACLRPVTATIFLSDFQRFILKRSWHSLANSLTNIPVKLEGSGLERRMLEVRVRVCGVVRSSLAFRDDADRFPIPAPRSCFQAFFRALQLAYANIIQWNAMVSLPPARAVLRRRQYPSDGGCARLRLPPFAMVQKLVYCPVACGLPCQQTRLPVLIL